jgi:hypothetical protein
LPDLFQEADATHIPAFFLYPLNAAKTAERCKPRLFRSHPANNVLLDLPLQVKLQLRLQFVFHYRLKEKRP